MEDQNYVETSKLAELEKAAEDFLMKAHSLYGSEARVSVYGNHLGYLTIMVYFNDDTTDKVFWKVNVVKSNDEWKKNAAKGMNDYYAADGDFWEEGAQKYGADT